MNTIATGIKIFVVLIDNFDICGIFSSQRNALEFTQGDPRYTIEIWIIDKIYGDEA